MYLFPIVFLALSINLEDFFGANPIYDLLPTALLAYSVGKYAFVGKGEIYIGRHWNKRNVALFAGYFAFFIITLLRLNTGGESQDDGMLGTVNTVVKEFLFVLFCYLYFSKELKKGEDIGQNIVRVFTMFVLAIAVDCLFWMSIYVFAHGSGGSLEEIEYNFILGLAGIQFEKKLIPIVAAHPNTMGMYCGATVAMLLVFFLCVDKSKVDRFSLRLLQAALVAGGVFIFIVDSRGTLVNSIVLAPGIVYAAFRLRRTSWVKYVILLVPVFPFIVLNLLSFLSDIGLADQLARENENLATANNRSIIWDACVGELRDLKPQHFFGYGANGQVAAGIDVYYNFLFPVNGMIVHNVFFQTVLDMGYVGACLYLLMLFIAMKNAQGLATMGYRIGLCFLAFFMCYLAAGNTESTHGVYNHTYNFCVYAITMLAMVAYNEARYRQGFDAFEENKAEIKASLYV